MIPPTLIPTALGLLRRFWPVAVALLLVGLLLLAYCEGKDAGGDAAYRPRLEGNVKAVEKKSEADTKAADTRVNDEVRAEKERAELKEVIEDAPDPAAARRAYRACVRLQQAARASGRPAPACG